MLPSSKSVLMFLNIFYAICGIVIIATAGWAKAGNHIGSLSILGGVIASGVFMLLIALFGIFGAWKVKKLIALYMLLLSILFIVQFSIAVAALAIGNNQQGTLAAEGWAQLSRQSKTDLQNLANCYGFDYDTQNKTDGTMMPGDCPVSSRDSGLQTCYFMGVVTCGLSTQTPCVPCYSSISAAIARDVRLGAGISLGFAFTELIGLAAGYVYYKGSFEALRVLLRLPVFDAKLIRAVGAEFVGMILFVYVGTSSVVGTFNPVSGGAKAQITDIALAFGLSIACLVHAIGHISGGHLNPAITMALVVSRKMKWFTGFLYVVAQCAGAILGAFLTWITTHDVSESCNTVPPSIAPGGAFLREFVLTFFLVFVVFGTIDPKRDRRSPGPLAIGLTVVVAHLASVTSTGTGINPARSLGPAVITGSGCWANHWVFWIAPLMGGSFAGIVYEWFFDFGEDKIISAKEAFTKEGRFEPESGRQTRQIRDNLHQQLSVEEIPDDDA